MRLITQNLLSCPSNACSYPANFPLSFQNVTTIAQVEAEFNEEFLRGFIGRLEWDALRKSAAEVRLSPARTRRAWRRRETHERGSGGGSMRADPRPFCALAHLAREHGSARSITGSCTAAGHLG
jgi:hypothetical protein